VLVDARDHLVPRDLVSHVHEDLAEPPAALGDHDLKTAPGDDDALAFLAGVNLAHDRPDDYRRQQGPDRRHRDPAPGAGDLELLVELLR
jgi:hypothetical protein